MNWNEIFLTVLLIMVIINLAVMLTILRMLDERDRMMIDGFDHIEYKLNKLEQIMFLGIAIANEEDEGETEIEE